MALQDHFRPPLSTRRHWHAFHNAWATYPAYRPVLRDGQAELDIWQETLAIGRALPMLPLWLPGQLCLPVDLEATYDRTCQQQRIIVDAD